MNYYSDKELEQVIEEGDRQPLPASSHVALSSHTAGKPRKRSSVIEAIMIGAFVFAYLQLANIVELPDIVLAGLASILVSGFAFVTIKGEKSVRRH